MTPCTNEFAVADHLLWMIFAALWVFTWRSRRRLKRELKQAYHDMDEDNF